MNNIIEDASKLTTIPEKSIAKLLKKFVYCIADAVAEDELEKKEISELDLGLGILYIKHNADKTASYKFVPGKYMEKAVLDVLESGENLLQDSLNSALVKKFIRVYKHIC